MEDKLHGLLEKIKELEHELLLEIQQKEKEFLYEVRKKKVVFEREIRVRHKLLTKKIHRYLIDARILNILTAPVIWSNRQRCRRRRSISWPWLSWCNQSATDLGS